MILIGVLDHLLDVIGLGTVVYGTYKVTSKAKDSFFFRWTKKF